MTESSTARGGAVAAAAPPRALRWLPSLGFTDAAVERAFWASPAVRDHLLTTDIAATVKVGGAAAAAAPPPPPSPDRQLLTAVAAAPNRRRPPPTEPAHTPAIAVLPRIAGHLAQHHGGAWPLEGGEPHAPRLLRHLGRLVGCAGGLPVDGHDGAALGPSGLLSPAAHVHCPTASAAPPRDVGPSRHLPAYVASPLDLLCWHHVDSHRSVLSLRTGDRTGGKRGGWGKGGRARTLRCPVQSHKPSPSPPPFRARRRSFCYCRSTGCASCSC